MNFQESPSFSVSDKRRFAKTNFIGRNQYTTLHRQAMNHRAIDSILINLANDTDLATIQQLGIRCHATTNHNFPHQCAFGVGENRVILQTVRRLPSLNESESTSKLIFTGIVLLHSDLQEASRRFSQLDMHWEWCRLEPYEDAPLLKVGTIDRVGMAIYLTDHPIRSQASGLDHKLPVKRLDHLAVITYDLEEQTRLWTEKLNLPLHGEVRTETMIIRQFKCGNAILELLGPASATSPLHQRHKGLITMMSLEVADLDSTSALVRSRGVTIADRVTGVLPGTDTATIPATVTGGLALQFLQYQS